MKRTLPLVLASALAATTAAVVAATGPAGAAGAEPVTATASDGELVICHTGLGTKGRINGFLGIESLESGTAISGTSTEYSNVRGCFSEVDELDERSRITFGYIAKKPYRLKAVRIQQTDGATVTVHKRTDVVSVLMDEGEEVTVTFVWGRPKRR